MITNTRFIDRHELLARCLNDTGFMKQMLEVFSDFVPQTFASLKSAIEAADLEAACRYVHTLKGSAANVSAETLRQVAFSAEQQAMAGDLDAVRKALPEINAALARCLIDAQSLLNESANPPRPTSAN